MPFMNMTGFITSVFANTLIKTPCMSMQKISDGPPYSFCDPVYLMHCEQQLLRFLLSPLMVNINVTGPVRTFQRLNGTQGIMYFLGTVIQAFLRQLTVRNCV